MPMLKNSDEIQAILIETFKGADPLGSRFGRVFRESFDQIYDGQHTGRFSVNQLSKTEAAHLGSIVEINIRREFKDIIEDGEAMDFAIEGHEVDCKYSKRPFGWMIPIEALGHYGMLCHANDEDATFRVGFLYLDEALLNQGGNRDRKRTVSKDGRQNIAWLHYDAPLPPNTLLQLGHSTRSRILSQRSGAARLNELFRSAREMIVPRGIIATVAQQKDYMKRIRYNGGSRSVLQEEGLIILGDYKRHQEIASALKIPVPRQGETVSVRVAPHNGDDSEPFFQVDGQRWRKAREGETPITAPIVPYS